MTGPTAPPILIRNIFRHPYPLPAPPSYPRNDDVIIASHSSPEKNINTKWVTPDADLSALIDAAGEDYNLVRRSNACGTLKVLASNNSNRKKLCRTRGLLDALVKASWDDAVDSDALDGRTRAVTTLLYLAEPKANRVIVARHPQLLDVLVKVIQEDTGEARWRATSALATLGKTPGNRGRMGRVPLLANVMGDLMVEDREYKPKNCWGVGGGKKQQQQQQQQQQQHRTMDNYGHHTHDGMISRISTFSDESTGMSESFDTMDDDERMLRLAFTGTISEGTGFSKDRMYQSHSISETHSDEKEDRSDNNIDDYDKDVNNDDGKNENDDDDNSNNNDDDQSNAYMCSDDDDDNSIPSESGIEMQISSQKKTNIEKSSEFLANSQLSACAALAHLTKHCANALSLCHDDDDDDDCLLRNVIFLSRVFDSPLHTRCIEMLCNFSRFPSNNARLAAMPRVVETLLVCGRSRIDEDRMWSMRTLQNLSSDASSKVGLASSHEVLTLLTSAAMQESHYDERFAAVGALMNICTEPGSLVHIMNCKTVAATLVHLAHSPSTPGSVRTVACDALATIGLWLQTLASTGTVPEEVSLNPLPTHEARGWLRWEDEGEETKK